MNNIKNHLDYIPYIEYDNKINDSFETSTLPVDTLLQLHNLSIKYNNVDNVENVDNGCNIIKCFKKMIKKLFM